MTVTALTGAPGLTNVTLSGAGTIGVTTDNATFALNSTIDASAATGAVTINAAAALANGLAIKGGAGNDVLIGTAQADVITAGAGNDVLATGAAEVNAGTSTATAAATITAVGTGTVNSADVLTGGAGNDSFAIGHSATAVAANVSSITDLNLGTNVVGGVVDSLWFNGATAAAATVVTLTAAQQTLVTATASLDAAVTSVLTAITAANTVAQFTYGADTYILASGAAAHANYAAATDSLIKITGVTGVLDASDIHFVAA